jgi:hypothetical protein
VDEVKLGSLKITGLINKKFVWIITKKDDGIKLFSESYDITIVKKIIWT